MTSLEDVTTSLEDVIASAREKAIAEGGKIIFRFTEPITEPFKLIQNGFLPVVNKPDDPIATELVRNYFIEDEVRGRMSKPGNDMESIRKYVLSTFALDIVGINGISDITPVTFGSSELNTVTARNFILEQLALGMTEDELRFWLRRDYRKILDLNRWQYWMYCTISYYRDDGEKTGNALPLLLYAPEQVYRSKRAFTGMQIFRSPGAVVYIPEEIKDGKYREWKVLPVTRYGIGMSRGMYQQSDISGKFCGTFYYHEPDSSTFLCFHTSITFLDKVHAFRELSARFFSSDIKMRSLTLQADGIYEDFSSFYKGNRQQREDMVWKTPLEFWRENPKLRYGDIKFNEKEVAALPQVKRYVGLVLGLYASEDIFDQAICELGRKAGYDIIILNQMIGSHQLVSEILDTRPRNVSFDNLIYLH